MRCRDCDLVCFTGEQTVALRLSDQKLLRLTESGFRLNGLKGICLNSRTEVGQMLELHVYKTPALPIYVPSGMSHLAGGSRPWIYGYAPKNLV